MMYCDLCRPCAEALREDGKTVLFVAGGRDHKVFCTKCCRRRYGATYRVTTDVRKQRKPKRVKSHAAPHD